jgi:predicted TIM-barrel fold metal-dependent hydrolase
VKTLLAIVALWWSCVAGAAEPIPFIDAHVHLNDEAMQLELMRSHGVERAVIFWGRASDNERIADARARHPDRFIAFVSVSPEHAAYRRAWQGDAAPLLAALDTLLASGQYHGIGEVSPVHFPSPGFPEADFDVDGPMMRGLMALARKHRMPVLLHIEWTRLDAFERLLAAHRDVTVIWAHGGYTPLFVAARLLERHANLVYELSARTWALHPRSPDYTILRDGKAVWPQWLALIEAQPQRFIVGSDAAQRTREMDEARYASVQNFLRQLTPATREAVARANLKRLLGLP